MAQTPRDPAHVPPGRKSIFGDKTGGDRVNGTITAIGSVRFELHRRKLARLVHREQEDVSDADVVEYMARGEEETRKYLARQQRAADALDTMARGEKAARK